MVGKTPIWPWHQPSYAKLDIALALATLLTCIPIASITIQRCRLTWHFILIAIWKLVTSVALSCTTIHRALISRRENHLRAHNRRESRRRARNPQSAPYQSHGMYEQIGASRSTLFNADEGGAQVQEDQTPLFWLILYLVGTMTGMAGLLALNWSSFRDNHDVRSLTYGFGVTIIIIPVMAAAYWYMKHLDLGHDAKGRDYVSAGLHMAGSFFVAGAAAFGFFSALYCDLVLAAIAQNWSGMPSEDFAPLYWAWFVAKRFPMLSI
ncbi:hypothetical protein EJ04DRAFT_447065 [Polyplosphaeria fusca]|uniref:Uncharacterized protein n=1 Tax=Polyplosphaeria fusca TaxID=682080 RepID=A0A9P4QQD2_9PLEO|nr:hypothetical protein EJ04DRAFT_447065 [Polyplosphaeria fusca]